MKLLKTHNFHVLIEYPSYLREIDVVKKNFLVFIVLKSDFDACGCAVVWLCGIPASSCSRDPARYRDIPEWPQEDGGGPPPGGRKEALLAPLAKKVTSPRES